MPNKINQTARKIVAELKQIMTHDGYDWFWEDTEFSRITASEEGELRRHIELWMRSKLVNRTANGNRSSQHDGSKPKAADTGTAD